MASLLGTMAGVGLLIGGFSMTGVAIAFSSELVHSVGNNHLALLLIGAVVSYILGMGMTITACYIFLAIVLVPALTPFGFDVMSIHLFVLYCGLFSFITPPVALAVYAASSLAESGIWETGLRAMGLGFVKYFVPFFFVYNPALILHGSDPVMIVEAVITAFLGVLLIGSSIEGYLIGIGRLDIIKRVIFFVSGFLLFFPERVTDIIGISVFGVAFALILLYRKHKKSKMLIW
jgi:TRAP-type uncharacterized transport system fused permease subunit